MSEVQCGFPEEMVPSGPTLLQRIGPTLRVQVGFDPSGQAQLPEQEYPALVDTGASVSCIDNALAIVLGLPAIDRVPVGGAEGEYNALLYLAQVRVPSLSILIHGPFVGVNLQQGGQPHFALLGRSLLSICRLVYDGPTGSVTISKQTS